MTDSYKNKTITEHRFPHLWAMLWAFLMIVPFQVQAQLPVSLGTAGNYTILTETGITNIATTVITGDIAVSPIDASAMTGFNLALDAGGVFATSDQVIGKVYAADYSVPTPTLLTTAIGDKLIAYNDAAGRDVDFTNLYAGDISGQTLAPGVYKWTTGLLITTDVTLAGDANAVWIFQITNGITQAAGAKVLLSGGAQASNIFWQAAEIVSYAAGAHVEGIVLAATSITLAAGVTVNGNLFAGTNVTLIQNTVTAPIRSLVVTGNEAWRMFSSPAEKSYASLLSTIWTQGTTGANALNGDPNVKTFNGTEYVTPSDLADTLAPGLGFIAYVYEDDDLAVEGVQGGFPKTIAVTGKKNIAPITASLNAGASVYTLAGNPFDSAIDWDLVTKSGVNNTAYVYDPAYTATLDSDVAQSVGGAYRAWNGTIGSLTDGKIAAYQGFWVESANGAPSLTFEDAAKVSSAVFYGKAVSEMASIHLVVSHKDGSNDAWIQFSENGEDDFDAWDGWKLQPFSPRFIMLNSGFIGNSALDINHLPVLTGEKEIPFDLQTTESGDFKLNLEALNLSDFTFEVLDNESGERVQMDQNKSFTFSVNSVSKVSAAVLNTKPIAMQASSNPRFTLIITPNKTTSVEVKTPEKEISLAQNFPNPFNPSTIISFNLVESSVVKMEVYNGIGARVDVLLNGIQSAGSHSLSWNASTFSSGIYLLKMNVNGAIYTRKMTLLK